MVPHHGSKVVKKPSWPCMVAWAACFLLLIYQVQGVENRKRGVGDVMRRCILKKQSRSPVGQHFYSVPQHPGAACPGRSPVTPPDRVLSPPSETDTI